jgi:hypothetical protein
MSSLAQFLVCENSADVSRWLRLHCCCETAADPDTTVPGQPTASHPTASMAAGALAATAQGVREDPPDMIEFGVRALAGMPCFNGGVRATCREARRGGPGVGRPPPAVAAAAAGGGRARAMPLGSSDMALAPPLPGHKLEAEAVLTNHHRLRKRVRVPAPSADDGALLPDLRRTVDSGRRGGHLRVFVSPASLCWSNHTPPRGA